MKNFRWRAAAQLLIATVLLGTISLLYYAGQRQATVQLAVAKGAQMLDMINVPQVRIQPAALNQAALASDALQNWEEARLEFVNATPLSAAEARPWLDAGCNGRSCAHVIYYNHTDGGTVNAIVQTATGRVLDTWADPAVRPAGSRFVLDRAMAIAAQDAGVTAVLGDIGAADPAMVPMSAWLADNDCRNEWCVDLSFLDPAGSGRVYHVFVNMTQDEVARTFYTRGRPELDVPEPFAQRGDYSDGCNEQYGWRVCWEMTAHDGVLFRDGAFDGRSVFETIKIPQVEAWYPSWPGGYRDEIGFNASVPPFGETQITDLGNGFEVRQLFTEFTRWPNCICCYRYEEVLRFLADGSFEARFVSHGPGCDDLSIYRPFWRIDLDVDNAQANSAWVWQADGWQQPDAELELFPFVDMNAPDGGRVVIGSEETYFHISMDRTDPLGLDEARFFILQENEGEGDGPTPTGPGDTFQPPRQWINGDPVTDTDLLIWMVPLLKTKKGGPWWCMPDPEPGINQCEAIVRFMPGEAPLTFTEEELAQLPTPTPTAPPQPTNTPAPTPTPRPIEGDTPEEIILNAGCGACHAIGSLGEAGKVGPDLSAIGAVAGERVPGLSAVDYMRQSILQPNAFIAPDCPNGPCLANVMPQDYETRLAPEQVETMVDYLLTLTEAETAVTVIGEGGEATPLPKAVPIAKQADGVPAYSLSAANLAVQLLLLGIVFLLTLFMLRRREN